VPPSSRFTGFRNVRWRVGLFSPATHRQDKPGPEAAILQMARDPPTICTRHIWRFTSAVASRRGVSVS
jgi:hypothetical protein